MNHFLALRKLFYCNLGDGLCGTTKIRVFEMFFVGVIAMTMKWFTKKSAAIGVGVLMGVSATILAMVPSSRSSEAAIQVIDEKNIEEAVKTAIQTAKILTEEQKQYALLLLNMKKFDLGTLEKFLGTQVQQMEGLNEQYGNYMGVLNKSKTLENIWTEAVGDFEAVMDGKLTVYDMYKMTKNRYKQTEDTYKDVDIILHSTQQAQVKRLKDMQEIQKASNEAEGELQAIQAGNAMTGTTTQAIIDGNNVMMGQLAIMEQEAAQRQAERYASQVIVNMTKQNSDKYLAGYDASKNMYAPK